MSRRGIPDWSYGHRTDTSVVRLLRGGEGEPGKEEGQLCIAFHSVQPVGVPLPDVGRTQRLVGDLARTLRDGSEVGNHHELQVGGVEPRLRTVKATVAQIHSELVHVRPPDARHGLLSRRAHDGVPLRPVHARPLSTVCNNTLRVCGYGGHLHLHFGVLGHCTTAAMRHASERRQHDAGAPPSELLGPRERTPTHADDWCSRHSRSPGLLVPVRMGHLLVAEASASRRHSVLAHFRLPAVPISSWSLSVCACAASAELRLGSCAIDSRPRLRNFRICNRGHGLNSPLCIDVAMGRTPGEPSGRRHAHGILAYFTPRRAADSVDEVTVGNLLVAVFSSVIFAFLGASAWSRPPTSEAFPVFLMPPQSWRRCLLSIAEGAPPGLLFGIVGEKTETLVVLCTREILHRPSCVREMTTARLHNIDTILVMFPDFEKPSRTVIDNYACVEGVQSLAPFGISLQMTQETLWWLGTRPWIVLPRSVNSGGFDAVVEKLVGRKKGRQEMATVPSVLSIINSHGHDENEEDQENHWRSRETVSHLVSEPLGCSTPAAVTVVSIVDHTNQESVCTALLVRELLKRFFPLTGPGHVLGPDENLLAACHELQRVLPEAELCAPAFPGWVSWNRRDSGRSNFRRTRSTRNSVHSQSIYSATGIELDADDLITLIKKLFEEIGIHVCPQDSQAVLEVGDVMLAQRFGEITLDLAGEIGHTNAVESLQSERGTHTAFARKCAELYIACNAVLRRTTMNLPPKSVNHDV